MILNVDIAGATHLSIHGKSLLRSIYLSVRLSLGKLLRTLARDGRTCIEETSKTGRHVTKPSERVRCKDGSVLPGMGAGNSSAR